MEAAVDLPISAERAADLLKKPALLRYVAWPIITMHGELPDNFGVGETVTVRLRLFGIVPLWTHTVLLAEAHDHGARTEEHGGVVRRWSHTLTLEPLSVDSCRYTDHVEIDAAYLTAPVTAFAHVFYRWRHKRWAALAEVLR